MKVYIVKQPGGELKIFTIKPEQEAAFLKEHGHNVIAEGKSIQEVILQFARLKADEEPEE